MRKLNRGIAAGLLSAPLVLGFAGVASAADFDSSQSVAGPEGVQSSQTTANADSNGDGRVSYEESHSVAGPDGAATHQTGSSSDSGNGDSGSDGGLLGILGL